MPVRWITSGTTYANSFVYGNVLVDAGVLPMAVQPYAGAIETIVITHAHYDHIAHIKEIARICGDASVCIHEADAPGLVDDARSLAAFFGARSPGIVPDTTLRDGDRVGSLRVIHTPGHTPGGICLYDAESRVLFSGDTVFCGGSFGRYDFPGGDREALAASINRLAKLEVVGLYPGHGEPVTTGGGRHIAAAREALRFYG
ncbi:MAG TPA: MBL fold metallo-hydrolase [Candidatus Methanoculleus thermohydrogenotrophicum]|jgi:hydroxyacylglutathione hydrolase|nr:MBL fold metallo-hydrolase [Candidatus Methanoculleus thermohydrogenotrophicum]NLM81521.1 MBL fold metallo-hydrolase [Candidatus Methanoculleus thermohydrogenotrophicum]HOB17647.1 MBL fold metallo-hydrolase [Candidatus Methanoculleus thermohydrogenotrophicum]HPZ37331.1 MBL fold metallo-hydrolase [Candidatus Methanoculleus thermohydrogenotrophicum]HQC91150.1 MBL fold metallo-hydrolase [Candidatus Methanoculleus thermohydrogenotrophicum]